MIEIVWVVVYELVVGWVGFVIVFMIGLDGFFGIGGMLIVLMENYEGVNYFYVFLLNFCNGIMEVIVMEFGKMDLEYWVFVDIMNYIMVNWDFE